MQGLSHFSHLKILPWWKTPAILALGKWRQENQEFKASLDDMRPCLLKTKKKKILFRLSFLWLPPCLPWSFLHYMTGCTPPHLLQYLLFLHCGIPSDLVSTVPLIGNCSGEDCNCLLKCRKWLHFNLCLQRPVLGFMPTTRKYICFLSLFPFSFDGGGGAARVWE